MPEDRRSTDTLFLDMVRGLKKDLEDHTGREDTLIHELRNTVEAFSSGASPEVQRKRNEYLDALIQKEKDRAAFRQAVIEKTLASLLWSILVGLTISVGHYFFPDKW